MTAVFPTFPGLTWPSTKQPKFSTRRQESVGGRELTVSDMPYPRWTWTLNFSYLRDKWDTRGGTGPGSGFDELRTLVGFFLQQKGAGTPFLLTDPTDFVVNGQFLGTGTGTITVFQLYRTMGTLFEPITAPNLVSTIYFNGVPQSGGYTVDFNTGLVTFTVAPSNGVTVTADFTYYFRVRFVNDMEDFENFMYQLWSKQKLQIISVLL